ncbi:MAG: NAD(P)H-dependent oxidoreductase subunit E [Deltaproteobacteria bacterium]|nr:NAD(P)H-dependent oxidoreductase subunit E [Deltaproteobacteria bacterium]
MSLQFFTPEDEQKLAALGTRYPSKQPLVLPALHLAQRRCNGVLTVQALEEVGQVLDLPYPHVYGVATFYTMFRVVEEGTPMPVREPVTFRVCTNISCMLRGAYDVLEAFQSELGLEKGEMDGDFALVEEECIAACANAPAVLCGNKYFLDVEAGQVGDLVDQVKKQVKVNRDDFLESEVA